MTLSQATSQVVLDTSVVSLLIREQLTGTMPYTEALHGKVTAISFQTIDELWFGALKDDWGDKRRNQLDMHIWRHEVIESSPELAKISASLRLNRERVGRRLETADAWIAATALLLKCPLASTDGDFEDIPGIEIFTPPLL